MYDEVAFGVCGPDIEQVDAHVIKINREIGIDHRRRMREHNVREIKVRPLFVN
ncbi:unannotated protein [freshwater metagenome]|uniref:Unannotated protein n=1 Tax=freshwater metagenome TaxID=449393 RepID=A0A6J6XGS4_9ZZZZ